MMGMHIGFFTEGYTPQLNGVATFVEALSSALEQQGHVVSIFAPAMGRYVDRRPRVCRFASIQVMKDPPLWLATPVSSRIFSYIPRLGLDIVHTHTPVTLHFLGYQVARRQHLPLVNTYHTLLPAHVHHAKIFGRPIFSRWFAEKYSAWTCNMCDHVIAPSEKVKSLLRAYGVKRPISIIGNGVELERFRNRPRGHLRTRLGLGADDKILLSVGRLTAEKNFGFLINMLPRLISDDRRIYLALVGQGPLKAEFESQAEKLGVRKNLLFTGPVAPLEMPEVYADVDVYVNASFSEVFSLATLEALAAGLPFVIVPDQALVALVEDGKNGFIAADLDEFAARVSEILNHPLLYKQMSAHSREKAQNFTIEVQARRLVNLYADLIDEKKSRLPYPSPLKV